ncbi:hypothetical protein [Thermotomaculum hydrothermale]|uniref:hypothetical protein n=1 Tax=Thermotomaculum hydrothermale TaxID=981385 RepID=UPI0019162F3F|nr:hypothetical protein [Thermotomaculum hydrothermale]
MRKEKVLFTLDPNYKCGISLRNIIIFLIFIFLFVWVNYWFFDLFKKLMISKHFNITFFLGLFGFITVFCLINIFLYLGLMKIVSNILLYDSFFEICILFSNKRVFYKDVEKIIFKKSKGGGFFEFLCTSKGKKHYYIFMFSINEELKGKDADYVIQKLKKIFEEKGIPVIEK